jgi:hypothetical protein
MIRFITIVILTALLSFITGLYSPAWWSFALVAFIVAICLPQTPLQAFASGFLALFLLWAGLAWWIDVNNDSILSSRISQLLGVGNHPFLLVLITGFISGLIAGLAAVSASFLRAKKKELVLS